MAKEVAFGQARKLLEWANEANDDPRRTRLDLLQVANYLAYQSRQSRAMRDLLAEVSDTLARQVVTGKDLEEAARRGQGWPKIEALPGPASYFHAGLRLAAHGAFRRIALVDDFEAVLSDVERLSATVREALGTMGPEWARELTLAAADMAAEVESRSRLIAAAKDVQQLITGGEVPTWEDCVEGAAGSAWPPLTLGVCPVFGGAFREDPDDFENYVGGATFATFVTCLIGFLATSHTAEAVACAVGIFVTIAIIALIAHFAA